MSEVLEAFFISLKFTMTVRLYGSFCPMESNLVVAADSLPYKDVELIQSVNILVTSNLPP